MSTLTVQSNLKAGQVPHEELIRLKKAHDVRTLRPCAGKCGLIGNADRMIDLDGEWFHGRCFVAKFGERALGALPKGKQDRLTLGDLGVDLMKRLCNHRSRR